MKVWEVLQYVPKLDKGQMVVFDPIVYSDPFTPYYDTYKGHIFKIEEVYTQEPHGGETSPRYKLICVDDPTVIVQGNVTSDVLQNYTRH